MFDKRAGGPFDCGVRDYYYGRNSNPHFLQRWVQHERTVHREPDTTGNQRVPRWLGRCTREWI